jgi:hypothetical protein
MAFSFTASCSIASCSRFFSGSLNLPVASNPRPILFIYFIINYLLSPTILKISSVHSD